SRSHGPQFLSHMHRINKEAGNKNFSSSFLRGTFSKIKEPENYKQKSLKRKPQDIKNEKSSVGIKNFFGPSTSKSSTSTLSNVAKKHKGADISTSQSVFAKEENLVSVLNGQSSTPTTYLREINHPVPFAGRGFELGSTSSEAPKSFLAELRKDIGYPKEHIIHQSLSFVETVEPNSDFELGSTSSEAPKSFLAELRKDIGYPKEHIIHQSLSFVETVQPSSRENKHLQNLGSRMKESTGCDNSSTIESKTVDKSKLRQSSIENFVKSPSRASNEKDHKNHDYVSQNNTMSVKCPVCSKVLSSIDINTHLDQCLITSA
ncbi:hypothetical protein TNCT_75891, partial [Trichonephila clavata]